MAVLHRVYCTAYQSNGGDKDLRTTSKEIRMGSKSQFYSSESGHVAYQIKRNEVKINMQANDNLTLP